MVHKYPLLCDHCRKPFGFSFNQVIMQSVYCYACEGIVTHRKEIEEKHGREYRAALRNAASK